MNLSKNFIIISLMFTAIYSFTWSQIFNYTFLEFLVSWAMNIWVWLLLNFIFNLLDKELNKN